MRKLALVLLLAVAGLGVAAQEKYANPVIDRDWPDPTIWEAEGVYYTVATGMRTILTSTDLVHWTDSGKAPLSEAARAKAREAGRNFWAPDVVFLAGRWMLYLTCYNSDKDCGIFAFSADKPDGPFEFIGKITHSTDTGIKDTIDPEVVRDPDSGQVWLFFGSVGSQHRVKLNPEGTALAEGAVYEHTAGLKIDDNPSRTKVFEGAYLHRHGLWWYLFVSGGNYGDGSYKIRVGRSRTLDGEFLDREGHPLTEGEATLLLASDPEDNFYGPGHNGEIITDRRGQDYMFFHCHNRASGTRSRFTFLQRMFWDEEEWPYFEGGKVQAEDVAPDLAEPAYWLGADISSANGRTARGETFKNFTGEREYELTTLLQELGLNAVRYRVWVNPRRWTRPGTPVEENPSHAGMCDKEDLLQNCLRAKDLGMAIMVDFHYSDTWADPKHQPIPAGWMGHDYETMKQDLYNHTVEVLQYLKDNGVEPKWVQIGNETRNGLLWNAARLAPGETQDPNNVRVAEHMGHSKLDPAQYAGFIDAGHRAAKSVFPNVITIVHLDNGYDQAMYDWNLGLLEQYGAQYDMVGMSLYPYWAAKEGGRNDADGVIADCIRNILHVYERFGKESMIVETGFEVSATDDAVTEESYRQFATSIRESRDRTQGHCHGVFYWAPESSPRGYSLGAFNVDNRPSKIMQAYVEAAAAR